MIPRRFITASLALSALVLTACGSNQDPALDVPDNVTTTSSANNTALSPDASFGPLQLTGANEIPGPGDEDGAGVADVFLESDGSICYDFVGIDGIATPTAAHIHEGGESEAGPVVLALETPVEGTLDTCAPDQGELISRIKENPAGFYLNVHNADFPDGALRGQLQG